MEVRVKNLNKKHRINERFIKKIAGDILILLGKRYKPALDIVFLSDPGIRPFNRRYKHKDRPTDVLSFDLGSCAQILISSDIALRNSKVFNTSFEEEVVLYVIHGILHLYGYDDGTKAQKERMSAREEIILRKLCQANLSKVLMPR